MILDLNDIMPDMYKQFFNIDEEALEKICTHSLITLKKVLNRREEILIAGQKNVYIKFFIPRSPLRHHLKSNQRKKMKNEKASA